MAALQDQLKNSLPMVLRTPVSVNAFPDMPQSFAGDFP